MAAPRTYPAPDECQRPSRPRVAPRQRGDTMFALFMCVLSLGLLSQIGSQTKWIEGVKFIVQPRFWPGLSLAGMLLFSGGYLIQSLADVRRGDGTSLNDRIWQPRELLDWLRTLEYAAYFLVYVMIVPRLGYLPATLVFCLLVTLRAGYRSPKFIIWSLVGGFIIVVVFKTLLKVKLPAGRLYDYLPEAVGGFLIRYF